MQRKKSSVKRRFCIFVGLLSGSPGFYAHADTLTIAVAANMQYAFDDIRTEFEKETGHDLKPVYNSSGKFNAQIMNGAPFDAFLSADMDYPQQLYKSGFAVAEPKPYAYGALVLWTMKNLDLTHWQSTLSGPAVEKIAIANSKTAPYGREAMKVLAYFKLTDGLTPKLVFGESIAQTNQYIYSQAADAGFTAKSVVLSPEMKGQGKWTDVPKDAYQPIAQGAVILAHGKENHAAAAQQFYDFLYAAKARAIFERFGYSLP